mgnify:CR=1 FL=1
MDKGRYTQFHEMCGTVEKRFGRQGHLQLKGLDLSVLKCKKLLDFGAGRGLNSQWCDKYYTLDADASLEPNFVDITQAQESGIIFDSIIANQVFEHIELDAIDNVIFSLGQMMKKDGIFVATIPNVHRGTYYFNDIDHKSPLMYYHLASFFELNGFKVVDAYRYSKNIGAIIDADAETKKIMEILETFYELDPAQFLAVVARRI